MRRRFLTAVLATAALAVLFLSSSCAGDRIPQARVQGSRFTLGFVPGPYYKYVSWRNVFPVLIYPQMACWVESEDGLFLGTIYATAKGARGSWISAPAGGRPEALPVWTRASSLAKGAPAAVDAVSGPTPTGAAERDSTLAAGLAPGTYLIKLEVNRSYDYNEAFTPANSGVDGQPSLIYEGEIEVGRGASRAVLRPFGEGAVDGSDGEVRPGLAGMTTALRLLDSVEVDYSL